MTDQVPFYRRCPKEFQARTSSIGHRGVTGFVFCYRERLNGQWRVWIASQLVGSIGGVTLSQQDIPLRGIVAVFDNQISGKSGFTLQLGNRRLSNISNSAKGSHASL